MPRAQTSEAESLRRRKISEALKGVPKEARAPLDAGLRLKLSSSMKNVWASRSADQVKQIGDRISAVRTQLAVVQDQDEKRCNTCGEARLKSRFSEDPRNKDGLSGRCLDCQNSAVKTWAKSNPDRVLFFRRRRYGIRFEQLWDQQKGLCALCGEPMLLQGKAAKSVCVDHDHACCPTLAKSCGQCVRGLIHSSCNRMLGQAKDDPKLLQLGAEYLTRWRGLK